MLDQLDRELARRGHRFVRYADDCNVYVRSERSGQRVMASLEGFINARVIVEALRRAGPNPTRPGLRQALESLKAFDLGIGAPLTFNRERHQGLDAVYFTRVQNERWVPVVDWNDAVAA